MDLGERMANEAYLHQCQRGETRITFEPGEYRGKVLISMATIFDGDDRLSVVAANWSRSTALYFAWLLVKAAFGR